MKSTPRSAPIGSNGRHEIKRGDLRLNVRAGRGWDRYCMDCARKIVDGSLASLTTVSSALESGDAVRVGEDAVCVVKE